VWHTAPPDVFLLKHN